MNDMKKISKDFYLKGLRCEICFEERVFGHPSNNNPNNLYIYLDLSATTRCFCRKHMTYRKEGSPAILKYNDDWDFPAYGAQLISEIIK